MATTFYLTNRAAPYTPATLRGAWDQTAGSVTKALDSAVDSSFGANTAVTQTETSTTNDFDMLLFRGVSGPLAAQTISGTLNVLLAVLENNSGMNSHYHLHVYVTQGDSDTPRGTLLTDYTEALGVNEFPTLLTAQALSSAASLSSLAVSQGDRLVVEIGTVARNTVATSFTATLRYGCSHLDGGFLPLVSGGDGTTRAGYVQFSGTVTEDTTAITTRLTTLHATAVVSESATVRLTQVRSQVVLNAVADAPTTNQQPPCCGDTPGTNTTPDPGSALPPVLQPWTRQITGGGASGTVADVDEGETWDTTRRTPNAWVAVTIQKQPTSEGTLEYRASLSSLADPNSYYNGLKLGEVSQWDVVERALSDWRGEFEVGTFGVILDDRAGRWRALFGSDMTKYVTGSDIVLRLISEEGRKAGHTPRRLFAGKVTQPQPGSHRQFGLQAEALMGSQYGLYDLDKPLLKRTWGDWGSTVPVEVQKKPVPFLWGELSDAGAVDSESVPQERGMVVPTYLGEYFVGTVPGSPPTEPILLHPPSGLTVTIFGTVGATHTVACGVTARNDSGQTALSNIVTVAGYPLNPSPAFYAVWTWTNPDNGTAKATEPYVQDGGGTPRYQLAELNNGGTWVNPESTFTDYGDVPHATGMGAPPPARGTAQVPGGFPGSSDTSMFYGVFGLLGHTGQILRIYASDLAPSPKYTPVQVSEIGDGKSFLVPGVTGWPWPDRWLEKNNQRWFFFLAQGPKAEAHKNKQMPFRCNLSGWDEDNIATGLVIDQGFRVYQDVLTQLVIGDWTIDAGQGYWFGPRLTIPTFPSDPTVPMIKSSTFEACQNITKTFTGDSIGYRVCVYLDDETFTARQFIAEMNDNLGSYLGVNAEGQLIAAIINDTLDVSTAPKLLQHRDILDWGDPTYSDNEIENVVNYEFDYNYSESKFRSTVHNVQDAASLAGYGERKGATHSWRWLRDANVAVSRANRELLHHSLIPRIQPITLDLRGMSYEIGDVIVASHTDGVGSVNGDVATPFFIERHITELARGTVTLVGREISYLL